MLVPKENNVWYEKCFITRGRRCALKAVQLSGDILMRRILSGFSVFALIGTLVFGLAGEVSAQRTNMREVQDTLRALNSKIDDLDYTLRYQLRSSSAGRDAINDATQGVNGLKAALKAFQDNLESRRENRDDVEAIITSAQDVNGFLRQNRQNRSIEGTWTEIRGLIERLSANYGVTPSWNGRISNASRDNEPSMDVPVNSAPANPLTGTYRIDRSRSEDIADILSSSTVSGQQRKELESKLDAPDELAISVRGDRITLASSKASPVSFVADGSERTEQSNGRSVRVKATLRGESLTVSSLGGETDYTITFTPDGDGLKVTRRITTDYLQETIFAESFYKKTELVAGLGINDDNADDDAYSSNDPADRVGANSPNPTLSQPRIGEFLIPNGTIVTGVLENEINTKVSQNNDRFKMTVQSPMEYRGAVIEGYISGVGRSGQISGRSNVTFNFERITLRNGKAYDFAGSVKNVKDQNGKEVRVDNEGTTKGDSQTKETAKRGGIGAGIGAVIGAIAGGGKGAVLGAIIGGGAGAGSVAIMGRDDIRLMAGSTISVESTSPIRNAEPVSEN